MTELRDQPSPQDDSPAPARIPYAPPAILWEEDYRPVAFGASCAKTIVQIPCQILYVV